MKIKQKNITIGAVIMNKVNKKYSRFIPVWLQKFISVLGNKAFGIIRKLILILKVISVITRKLAVDNPYMTIGASLGLTASIVLYQVPVLGWLIGPVATLFLVLSGAYLGHSYRSRNNSIVSFFHLFVDYIYRIIVAMRQQDCNDPTIAIPVNG